MPRVKPSDGPWIVVNQLSALFNGLFAVKLLVTPFLVYLTEPFPWSPTQAPLHEWASFEKFNNGTFAYLSNIYNHDKFNSHDVCIKDSQPAHMLHYTNRFPGALFFCLGISHFVNTFLGSTVEERKTIAPFQCQHFRYFGFARCDACLWFEPHMENN
ncbi:hypothetical protein Ae201684P_020265 [Aphanomyces euteiches]|nr:hypothetical protein Ae201684P_020265 [Aphanomyces euteiches]